MGQAKERLKLNKSIRISKFMHEWLNVGKQKHKINPLIYDGKCPCCGQEEDQNHMFQCTNQVMRETAETGLKAIEAKLYKENVPIPVRLGFVDELRKATQTNRGRKAWHCEQTDRAISAQETLGSLDILRGHHHTQWAYLCHNRNIQT